MVRSSERSAQAGELGGDRVEAVERLAQREGQAGPDLQDGEAVVDQGRERRGGW